MGSSPAARHLRHHPPPVCNRTPLYSFSWTPRLRVRLQASEKAPILVVAHHTNHHTNTRSAVNLKTPCYNLYILDDKGRPFCRKHAAVLFPSKNSARRPSECGSADLHVMVMLLIRGPLQDNCFVDQRSCAVCHCASLLLMNWLVFWGRSPVSRLAAIDASSTPPSDETNYLIKKIWLNLLAKSVERRNLYMTSFTMC